MASKTRREPVPPTGYQRGFLAALRAVDEMFYKLRKEPSAALLYPVLNEVQVRVSRIRSEFIKEQVHETHSPRTFVVNVRIPIHRLKLLAERLTGEEHDDLVAAIQALQYTRARVADDASILPNPPHNSVTWLFEEHEE